MIFLLSGASHTGKTTIAQKLMEETNISFLSIDHLKMGLIRSGYTSFTPEDDQSLTTYLWPVIKGIIKTAIENHQNLIIEGCYIPFDWKKDFEPCYLAEIRYYCIILSSSYIRKNFEKIQKYACVSEQRIENAFCIAEALEQNRHSFIQCKKYHLPYILIHKTYSIKDIVETIQL